MLEETCWGQKLNDKIPHNLWNFYFFFWKFCELENWIERSITFSKIKWFKSFQKSNYFLEENFMRMLLPKLLRMFIFHLHYSSSYDYLFITWCSCTTGCQPMLFVIPYVFDILLMVNITHEKYSEYFLYL